MLRVTCPGCGNSGEYQPGMAGMRVKCKGCSGWVQLPSVGDDTPQRCMGCGFEVKVGQMMACPKCGAKFTAPAPAGHPVGNGQTDREVSPPPGHRAEVATGSAPPARAVTSEPKVLGRDTRAPLPDPSINNPPAGGMSRSGAYGCLFLAVPLLLYGAWGALKVSGAASRGDAEALGMVCGSFLPGLVALGVAVHFFRRSG